MARQKKKIRFSKNELERYEKQGVDISLLVRRLAMTPTERLVENFRFVEDLRSLRPFKKT